MKRKRTETNDEEQQNPKRQNTGFGFYSALRSMGNAIYNAFTSTPVPQGVITQVPDEIRFNIMNKLTLKDFISASRVNKNFNFLAMQCFNDYLKAIPNYFDFGRPNLSAQQKLLCFSSVRDTVATRYPSELIDILGIDNIAAFSNIQKNTMKLYAKVQSSEADEGKIVSVKYAMGCSRLTDNTFLCSEGNLLPHDVNKRIRGTGTYSYWPNEATALEYLGRLAKGEHCGEVIDNIEEPLKTTPEGLSIVRLCDKEGNILDLANCVSKKPRL